MYRISVSNFMASCCVQIHLETSFCLFTLFYSFAFLILFSSLPLCFSTDLFYPSIQPHTHFFNPPLSCSHSLTLLKAADSLVHSVQAVVNVLLVFLGFLAKRFPLLFQHLHLPLQLSLQILHSPLCCGSLDRDGAWDTAFALWPRLCVVVSQGSHVCLQERLCIMNEFWGGMHRVTQSYTEHWDYIIPACKKYRCGIGSTSIYVSTRFILHCRDVEVMSPDKTRIGRMPTEQLVSMKGDIPPWGWT